MSGFLSDLSKVQEQRLNQFRENLKDVLKPEHDDAFLLRWLRARRFDLSKSEKMLRDHFEFRIKYDCDNIQTSWKPPEVLDKYMIGGLFGEDRDGHPVWYDPYGCLDTKGIFYSCTRQDFVKYKVLACETIQEVLREQSKKMGHRIETINVVFDLEHASWSHLWRPFTDRYSHVLTAYEANYPETLRRGIIINAPKMFTLGFQLIKPFLSEETKQKVMILGSNYKDKLQEFIHPDQLPVHYGGKALDEYGDAKCRSKICFGGKIPSSYYLNQETNNKYDNMSSCVVPHGKYEEFLYDVTEPGSCLKWDFRTKSDNVTFGIFLEENGSEPPKDVVPLVKCESHIVPETGEVICEKIGRYIIRFDNTYSWIKSKTVFYSVVIIPPSNGDCPD